MRNSSLLQLRTWARQLSDTENDPFVTDTELNALANRHQTEVYDRLVDAGPPERFASTATYTTSVGVPQLGMGADFRNLLDVYLVVDGFRTALQPMRNGARGNYQAPTQAYSIEIEYIPTPLDLVDDTDTFDGVSGWDELIANLMARDIMIKREADPSAVMSNIARLEQRIATRSKGYDKGHPKYITDLDDAPNWQWMSGSQRGLCYRLRGNNVEIYESAWGWP